MTDKIAEQFEPDKDWDGYTSYRSQLEQLRVQQVTTFDHSIVNLASGALGLSVVLLTALVAFMEPVSLSILFSSWVVFVLCIIANLLSYQTGAKAAEVEIQALDAEMRGEEQEFSTVWRTMTLALNRSMVVLFPSGAILLLIFAAINALAVDHQERSNVSPKPSITAPHGK